MLSEKAERRQLTIMFCDLVDSVVLSTRLDPEDLRDVIAAYHQTCARSVESHSGYVARYLGDGILIYFGYPAAHEDDAERAVRAGLDLVDAVAKLNNSTDRFTDLHLRVRVGIATGLVVVGDELTDNLAEKGAIAGEAVNLAARLQSLAGPNTVVASAVTRQLAGERFEYRDLGAQEIKGFARPVPIHQVIGEREVSRLAARQAALTPFVNRDKELEMLFARWTRANTGDGQVVVISGDAGIGKSRIAAELCARVRQSDGDTLSPLLFQCSSAHTNSPLYPVIKQLERIAGINRLDPSPANFTKLEAFFADNGRDDYQRVSLFADLLGLEPDESRRPLSLSPIAKRNLTIEALNDWVAGCARETPLLILFEDVQWIDPTSKVFLNTLVDWAEAAPVLLLITLRTEGAGAEEFLEAAELVIIGREARSHVTIYEVGDLGAAAATQLAATVAEGRTIPEEQLNAILAKSDGIPLYLEELVKAVVNRPDFSAVQEEGDQADAVPSTLRDALMAQLDRLGRAKQVAQYASVIGHEFSPSRLAKVTAQSVDELTPELRRLVNSKILVQTGAVSDTFRFKHALLRDISYRSLLRRTRRLIHLRVARDLADPETNPADATDDLIAQHYSRGEAYAEAVLAWQRAAKAAIARSAHEEALAILYMARTDLRKLRGSEWRAVELDLVLAQAIALRSLRGYSAPEVEERLLEARELCSVCSDSTNRFNVEWGLFQCTIVKRDIIGARQLAIGLFEHAQHHPDRPFVDAYLASGMVAVNAGEFEAARDFLGKGVSLSRPETDEPHYFGHGQNPGLFCLSYLARTLCFLGYLDCGRETMSRCLAIASDRADDPGHVYGYVNALIHAVRVHNLCGDLDAEERLANETYEISRRNHYAYYEAQSTCHLGWVTGARGSLSEGIDKMVAGLAALQRTATSLALPGFYLLLSELYIRAARWADANTALASAVSSGGHAVWNADFERMRGDLLSLGPNPDLAAAERAYRSSLNIARRQGAGLLIFKAGVSLARLLHRLRRRKEGREILSACREKLHGKFGTADLRDARMLMEHDQFAATGPCKSGRSHSW